MISKGVEVFPFHLTIKQANGDVRLTSTFYGVSQEETINEVLSNADTFHPETAPHYVAEFLVFNHNTETEEVRIGARGRDVLIDIYGKDASLRVESTLIKNKSFRWLVRVKSEVFTVDVSEIK